MCAVQAVVDDSRMGQDSGRFATRDTVHAGGGAGGRALCTHLAADRQQPVQRHFETA